MLNLLLKLSSFWGFNFIDMKIICPQHDGPVEKDIIDACNSDLKSMVFHCPVCEEQILIHDIKLKNHSQAVLKRNTIANRKQ